MTDDRVVVCDKCKEEFAYRSIHIDETSVEVDGDVLLLNYFTCPFCNTVYKVLLAEEAKYRELVDDLASVKKRICRQNGKGNPMLMVKLQNLALAKQNRIKAYVESMNKKYPGTFQVLEGNRIVYLPREYVD